MRSSNQVVPIVHCRNKPSQVMQVRQADGIIRTGIYLSFLVVFDVMLHFISFSPCDRK